MILDGVIPIVIEKGIKGFVNLVSTCVWDRLITNFNCSQSNIETVIGIPDETVIGVTKKFVDSVTAIRDHRNESIVTPTHLKIQHILNEQNFGDSSSFAGCR